MSAVDTGEVAQVNVIAAEKSRRGAVRLDAIAGERQVSYPRPVLLKEAAIGEVAGAVAIADGDDVTAECLSRWQIESNVIKSLSWKRSRLWPVCPIDYELRCLACVPSRVCRFNV